MYAIMYWLFWLVISICVIIRNERVFKYRMDYTDRIYNALRTQIADDYENYDDKLAKDLFELPSYIKMLFLIKRLNDNNWLETFQIDYLKKYSQTHNS